jgi:hypothetical protein
MGLDPPAADVTGVAPELLEEGILKISLLPLHRTIPFDLIICFSP